MAETTTDEGIERVLGQVISGATVFLGFAVGFVAIPASHQPTSQKVALAISIVGLAVTVISGLVALISNLVVTDPPPESTAEDIGQHYTVRWIGTLTAFGSLIAGMFAVLVYTVLILF